MEAYSYRVVMVVGGTTVLELVVTVPAAHSTASPIMLPVVVGQVVIRIQPPTVVEPVVVPGPAQVVQVIEADMVHQAATTAPVVVGRATTTAELAQEPRG